MNPNYMRGTQVSPIDVYRARVYMDILRRCGVKNTIAAIFPAHKLV